MTKTKPTNTPIDEILLTEIDTDFRNEPRFEDPIKYVVVRDDRRVSDHEYMDKKDSRAINENNFWSRVVNNWSPGEKVEIAEFNKKKHRIW